MSSIQRKAPRTDKLKDKTSKCALCKKLETNLQSVSNVQGSVSIESLAITRKSILLKIITAKKILTANQIANLERKNTKFVSKFCRSCIQKYTSPEFFDECQNKKCSSVQLVKHNLEPDLNLFNRMKENEFRICKIETAKFCQFCRQAKLSNDELRLLNQLLDRSLMGKSVALVDSQRTRRASNLGGKLMPRAIAVFPVVSKNIFRKNSAETELHNQLNLEIEKDKIESRLPTQDLSRTVQNKYREYEKIELSLRKLVFKEKSLESLLYSRKHFLRRGVSFQASQYTDEHLAGLLKLNFKETQLEALQKSMELITGVKLTSNLKENLKLARNRGLKDAGKAGEIQTGQKATAKYWICPNIKEIAELQIRRAREKSILAFHTNQKKVWKFSVGSDKASGIHYTHLTLENSLEPASAKTSITISGIYDTEDCPSRRFEIMKVVRNKIAKINLKQYVKISFPELTDNRLDKLRNIHHSQGENFIDQQIIAKQQLRKKTIPESRISYKFKQPVIFKLPGNLVFKPITARALKVKIGREQIIQPIGKVEKFQGELQDLSNLKPDTNLTLCPLCCRAFLSKVSACKHVILCHENYGEEREKLKFLSNLKSAVDVRVTNLSQLLLNQLTTTQIIQKANEIVIRQPINPEYEPQKVLEMKQDETNYHVSQFCSVCLDSEEAVTPPILAEILFENQTVEFPILFTACGDGLELVELAGVTKGYCYKCELQNVDTKLGRGRRFSRQPIVLNGESAGLEKHRARTLKRANEYSKKYLESETKNLTKRRKENFQYERQPINQYSKSIEEVEDPEFHTALNIATQRIYLRGLEYCKLMDAHLLENKVVEKNQQQAFNKYTDTLSPYESQKKILLSSSLEIKNQISKLEQDIKKANENISKCKPGKITESTRRAKKRRTKKRKKLVESKRKLRKEELKFETSAPVKKFKKARLELLTIHGPMQTQFVKLGFVSSKKKGCSLEGRETYNLLKSKNVMKVIFGCKTLGGVHFGDQALLTLAEEYARCRYKELGLTCYQRSFCHHEIDNIEIFNGAASRLEPYLYSDQIMLMSSHFRDHVVESLKRKKELIARDSLTEYMNQRALKLEKTTKYARSFPEKVAQMNQQRHTHATAIDYTARRRTKHRAETSTVFPDIEQK